MVKRICGILSYSQFGRNIRKNKSKKRNVKRKKRNIKSKKRNFKRKKQGKGFLPSDPNALCERLELLMASKQAGNTGLRNEIVSICDELLRQKNLSRDAYKNLMLALNKYVNY